MGLWPLCCGHLVDLVYSLLNPKLTHCFFRKPFAPGVELRSGNKHGTRQTQTRLCRVWDSEGDTEKVLTVNSEQHISGVWLDPGSEQK